MLICEKCKSVYQCPTCNAAAHDHSEHSHQDDKHLSAEEMQALKATRNINEWRKVCEDIKAAHEGNFPADWMKVVLGRGGCAASIIESWKAGQ
jgi:hypothetical protein